MKSTESVFELEFLNELHAAADQPEIGLDRRLHERFPLRTKLEVQPLDEHLAPCGEFTVAVTNDVSRKGIGLTAAIPPQARFLRLRLTPRRGKEFELLYEIAHRYSFGPFCRIGARIVRRPQTPPGT